LTNGGSIDKHHNSLAYVEIEADSPADGEFEVMWSTGSRGVTVSGPCPACGGQTATEFSPGIGGSKGFRRPAPRSQSLPSPMTIFCDCGHKHAGRPPGALDKGCGRFWLVFLPDDAREPPQAGQAGTPVAPTAS
jgi:hypothetical protein